jgi:hypothetical protein
LLTKRILHCHSSRIAFRRAAWNFSHHPELLETVVPPRIARLAALGAFGACAGIFAIYLLLLFGTRPTPYSGLDGTLRFLTWLTVAGVILALIAVHVVLGRQLLALSRGETPPA